MNILDFVRETEIEVCHSENQQDLNTYVFVNDPPDASIVIWDESYHKFMHHLMENYQRCEPLIRQSYFGSTQVQFYGYIWKRLNNV